jgi:hypothetical protein
MSWRDHELEPEEPEPFVSWQAFDPAIQINRLIDQGG